MTKEELQNIAFEIISYSGNAFSYFYQAVEEMYAGNKDKALELLKTGESELNLAHNAQTNLLGVEANGENLDFSIILIHAQDHLMTTIMYERIAKQLIKVIEGRNISE